MTRTHALRLITHTLIVKNNSMKGPKQKNEYWFTLANIVLDTLEEAGMRPPARIEFDEKFEKGPRFGWEEEKEI